MTKTLNYGYIFRPIWTKIDTEHGNNVVFDMPKQEASHLTYPSVINLNSHRSQNFDFSFVIALL